MQDKALRIICTAAASLSVAATLLFNAYAGIAFASLSSASLYLLRKSSGGGSNRTDDDSMRFVGRLIDSYTDSINTPRLLEISLSQDFWFYKDMREAISKYTMQGNAELSFSKPLMSDSGALREITAALVQRLDNGVEILGPLKEIRRRIGANSRHRLKTLCSALNSDSVARLGSVAFFPAFAGISLQIVKFTNSSEGFAAAKPWALVAIFAFYIIYTNIINFRYSSGDALRIEKSALSGAIGILVFKMSSMLSIGML